MKQPYPGQMSRGEYGAREGFLCIVMHPQVIGRRSRMAMLERLIQHTLQHEGVWFATHLGVAQAWMSMPPHGA